MAGYMGSYKGATGPVVDTDVGAAEAFFERYPNGRRCIVTWVIEIPGTEMVRRDYAAPAMAWKKTSKGVVNSTGELK